MRLDVSAAPGEVSVHISDKDGYSPDKLDDWVTRAVTIIAAAGEVKPTKVKK